MLCYGAGTVWNPNGECSHWTGSVSSGVYSSSGTFVSFDSIPLGSNPSGWDRQAAKRITDRITKNGLIVVCRSSVMKRFSSCI